MERRPAIDVDEELAFLVSRDSLEEFVRPLSQAARVTLRVEDTNGQVFCEVGSASGSPHTLPLLLFGQSFGRLIVTGGDAAQAESLQKLCVGFLEQAKTLRMTSRVHMAALDNLESELADRDRRLARTLAQLREVDRLKANFLATISHELRTPLTSVIGYAEMMMEGLAGDLSRQQRECLGTILSKADELLQLITGLLDASLLEARSLSIQPEPISLSQIAEVVTRSLAVEAKRRDIQIVLPSAAVPRAHGDEGKIRQVMLHLLANAIKFSPRGARVVIDVDVAPMSPKDRPSWAVEAREPSGRLGLRVRVQDVGIGIATDEKDRIFEPFFQADSSTTREFGGTGLGLSLAKLYVEAHGGNIWVESEVGRGSTFTVTIPAVADELKRYAARRVAEQVHE